MTIAPEADAADELVLEPPSPLPPVSSNKAASTIKVDDATAARIEAAVNAYVEALTSLRAESNPKRSITPELAMPFVIKVWSLISTVLVIPSNYLCYSERSRGTSIFWQNN